MNLRTAVLSALVYGSLGAAGAAMAQSAPTTSAPAPQSSAPMQSSPAPTQSSPAPMQQGSSHKLASSDKNFLENAAQAGHTEIEGSKMAQSKSSNPDVKAFADQMIQDHTKVGQELDALAKSKGYTPPAGPSLVEKTKLKTLSLMKDSFDKKYASQIGVSAHEDAVKLFQKASTDAKDPDIKAFAAKNLPTLQHHLDMAKTLQQKVGK